MFTKKEIRYAMIKGKAEKKKPELKPPFCIPLNERQLTNYYIEYTLITARREKFYGGFVDTLKTYKGF
jgi:hypothetical protein